MLINDIKSTIDLSYSIIKFIEKTTLTIIVRVVLWLREQDLNLRPLGYEPNELPTAPSRDIKFASSVKQLVNLV